MLDGERAVGVGVSSLRSGVERSESTSEVRSRGNRGAFVEL